MKKMVAFALCVLTASCMMMGCSTSTTKSVVFEVETGDKIKMTLDTSEDYNLSKDLPFEISQDDEVLSIGTFITEDGYDMYCEVVEEDEKAELLDSGEVDGNEYISVRDAPFLLGRGTC